MLKRNVTGVLGVVFIMIAGAGDANAGLFSHGGGESRTITSISPDRIFNARRTELTLSGRFSKNQSRDRRVVISLDRLPTPFPARVYHWTSSRITVAIPKSVQPGGYQIFLQRAYRNNGGQQWRAISNKKVFTVLGGSLADQSSVNIRVVNLPSFAQACTGSLQIGLSGGAFQNGTRVELSPPSRYGRTSIRNVARDTYSVMVNRCWLMNTRQRPKLRLIYPGGHRSNWVYVGTGGLSVSGIEVQQIHKSFR